MSLSLYKKKRSFDKTPEPSGKEAPSDKALRFVIQKHDASRLHYDFRLELEGVLKSWAVPKGPSLNPDDKRLAVMVEDHPYDYRTFEGIIPPGNYGAGTVIVWDEGTYEPYIPVDGDKKQQEKELLQELYKGDLKIKLNGKKIKGAYALVKIKGSEENAWLLIKKKDEYASTIDITSKDKSVVSGKTIEQVEKSKKSKEWQSNRPASSKKKIRGTSNPTEVTSKKKAPAENPELKKLLEKGKRSAFPSKLTPMLASLGKEPFDNDEWVFEIKWDGYRAVAFIRNGHAELLSRNNLSFNKKFFPVAEALQSWDINAVVDGEIIAVNEKGVGDFQQLQAWQKTGRGELEYYAFDLLWLEGINVMNIPLVERKEILRLIVPEDAIIKYSDHFEGRGKDLLELASKQGLEGIMAKKADSVYVPGTRTHQWLKIKTHQRQEVIIGGFTKGRNSRKFFGALILGVYQNGELVYVGHTGSGFNTKSLVETYKKLEPLIIKECPFKVKPKTNMPAVWVKPELVAEVKFHEWTQENYLRQAIFLGLRDDKKASDVKKEESVIIDPPTDKKKKSSTEKNKISKTENKKPVRPSESKKKRSQTKESNVDLLNETEKDQVVNIHGHELKFTNLHKFYWKKERITKRDMINYYHRIAPYMLPYLRDRPQSLNRHPDGIDGMSFYQKDVAGKVPDWIETYDYISESDGETKQFLVCNNEASLLYMANWGCIEMNPWHSRVTSAENPDWCVIDLDPEKISFDKVIESAKVVKKITDALGIETYCKTSGSTGIHIYIPLGAKYTYAQSLQLAELIVTLVHDEIPSFTSLERSPKKRQGKVYLDYLQNRTIQTLAAPYSIRPKPGATVSAPLYWEELKTGLTPTSFTMMNIFDRLKSEGDIFKPVLQKGINLDKVLKKAGELLA